MAGGYTGYFCTYNAWDVIRPLDVPKGYGYMKNFGYFCEVQLIGNCNPPTNWPGRVAAWRIRARSILFTRTRPLPLPSKSPEPPRPSCYI